MAAPAFFDVLREAERIQQMVPAMTRKAESLRHSQELTETLRSDILTAAAQTIRNCDQLLELLPAVPAEHVTEVKRLTEVTAENRKLAFSLIEQLNPDQAWFWTEEWQAGERAVDRDIAAGVPMESGTPEEFLAALAAISAQKE